MNKHYKQLSGIVLAASCFAIFNSAAAESVHWCYAEEHCGPAVWGDLSEDFYLCKAGLKQTPINLYEQKEAALPSLNAAYKNTPLTIKNNGHTIQVNYQSGSYLTVGSKKYQLLQFHFHTPSEHLKNGRAYPMEVHFVHADDYGALGVVGVFLKESDYDNAYLKPIFDNMPKTEGEVTVAGMTVNALSLWPKEREYFNYAGSLTTPPCSEGVNWMVMEDVIGVSKKQLEQFRAIFEMNARPEQPLNGRTITKQDD